jgi:hypothetical protein
VATTQAFMDDHKERHPDAPTMSPSLFIHDKTAKEKLIHFPPTKKNRAMLEAIVAGQAQEGWTGRVQNGESQGRSPTR